MAVFDPQFDTPQANYLKLSKPTSQPYAPSEGDKSTGIALKTLGEGLTESVSLADSTIKSVIKDDLDEKIRDRRQKFVDQMDGLLGNKEPNPSNPMDANAGPVPAAPMDLMPQNTAAPTGVERAIDTVQKLQNARDQSGKFRTTSMDADIDRTLKAARAQWPGYKDYIDEQSSKILGYNVANKLVSDKLAQLNELAQNSKSERDKVETFIRSHSDVTGFAQTMANYKAGRIDADAVYQWAGEHDKAKADLQLSELKWKANQAEKNLSQAPAIEYGEKVVDHFVNDAYRNNRLSNGQNPLKTGAEIQDTLTKIASDPTLYPGDEQMEILRNQYEATRADAASKIHAIVFTPNPKTGRSVADDWGVDNANTFIKKSLDAAFSTTSNLFSKKDFALAESNARRVAAVSNDTNMRVLNSDIGQEAALSKAVSQDPAMSAVVSNKIMTSAGFVGKLNNLVESKVLRGATQFDLGVKGKPNTLSQDISDINNTNANAAEKAAAVKTFTDIHKIITDSKTSDASKLATVRYLTDTSNAGFLQKLKAEGNGPDGQPTKGQIDVFEAVTNTKLSEEIWKLSQRTGDKSIWEKYTSLAQHEFGVKLKTDIENLNNLSDRTSIYGGQWHYKFNDESKQFEVLTSDGLPLPRMQQTWLNPAFRTIDVFNRGLANIRDMAKVSGMPEDKVETYVFDTLRQAGWNPTKDVDGVPARLMNAILAAQGKPETAVDRKNYPKPPVSR